MATRPYGTGFSFSSSLALALIVFGLNFAQADRETRRGKARSSEPRREERSAAQADAARADTVSTRSAISLMLLRSRELASRYVRPARHGYSL